MIAMIIVIIINYNNLFKVNVTILVYVDLFKHLSKLFLLFYHKCLKFLQIKRDEEREREIRSIQYSYTHTRRVKEWYLLSLSALTSKVTCPSWLLSSVLNRVLTIESECGNFKERSPDWISSRDN
jgi:hypothetical protein